jgi:glycerol uptake facilitator-like aquaporin
MNPAISLAMWRFGVFPGGGALPYIIAQLLRSVLGVLAARAVWGPVVAQSPVAYAVLQPGPGRSSGELFAAAVSMAVIVFLVGICLAGSIGSANAAYFQRCEIAASLSERSERRSLSHHPTAQFRQGVLW